MRRKHKAWLLQSQEETDSTGDCGLRKMVNKVISGCSHTAVTVGVSRVSACLCFYILVNAGSFKNVLWEEGRVCLAGTEVEWVHRFPGLVCLGHFQRSCLAHGTKIDQSAFTFNNWNQGCRFYLWWLVWSQEPCYRGRGEVSQQGRKVRGRREERRVPVGFLSTFFPCSGGAASPPTVFPGQLLPSHKLPFLTSKRASDSCNPWLGQMPASSTFQAFSTLSTKGMSLNVSNSWARGLWCFSLILTSQTVLGLAHSRSPVAGEQTVTLWGHIILPVNQLPPDQDPE